eukprot:scaffold1355_cov268-Pinguiococcus_pyrenoidosus.AAC.84
MATLRVFGLLLLDLAESRGERARKPRRQLTAAPSHWHIFGLYFPWRLAASHAVPECFAVLPKRLRAA